MSKIFLLLIFIFQLPAIAKPLNIVLMTPNYSTDPFWSQVSKIAQVTATGLDIKLTVIANKPDIEARREQYKNIKRLTEQENKPDYIVFMPFVSNVLQTFDLLEQAKIRFVTFDRVFELNPNLSLGWPHEKYKYWIGEVFSDNEQAGELLADYLILKAKNAVIKYKNGSKLTALGLSGNHLPESNKRNKGLFRAIDKNDITLKQVATVDWKREIAEKRLLQLVKRHGKPNIIWCASDVIAFGALDATKQVNLLVNRDVFVGGIDWTPQAIQKISKNQLTASVGGDIFQAAGTLINIFDYHHGIDNFNHDKNYKGFPLALISIDNIDEYQAITTENYWHNIDYTLFSKTKNKEAKEFTLLNILNALAETKTYKK
jgi:ABC-type sugar transport system substrate-binding protein